MVQLDTIEALPCPSSTGTHNNERISKSGRRWKAKTKKKKKNCVGPAPDGNPKVLGRERDAEKR
jgi:hypothetical protein